MSTSTRRDPGFAATPTARSEWFWCELDALRSRWDPLAHPFYASWTAGEIARADLATFAEEYDHLVVALATLAAGAAEKAPEPLSDLLQHHAREEREHVLLWTGFSRAAGWSQRSAWHYACDPYAATLDCSRTWAGSSGRPLAADLVTINVATAAQGRVAAAVLPALLAGCGLAPGAGTEYFRLHADVDRRHARLARWALERLLPAANPFPLLAQAEAALREYWDVLDEIEAARRPGALR